MRILILGAGAVGGYFGAAMQLAGLDVTFLVRPGRAETLKRNNLQLESDILGRQILPVKTLTADQIQQGWNIILLTCKAYDLSSALTTIAPFMDSNTQVLPLLNGIRHLDLLKGEFGAERILGGTCKIFADLSPGGIITQSGKMAELTFGLMQGQDALAAPVKMAERLREALSPVTGFLAKRADPIERALWDKWALLAPLAAMTSLMRGNVGEIVHTKDGEALMRQMIDEVAAIAAANAYPIENDWRKNIQDLLTKKDSSFAASMAKDIAKGNKIEGDHIIGDLIARAKAVPTPMLKTAYCHLQVYQQRL